ncbi:uncharacterized protein LOC127602196 isoform X2 [Hippocampus zosterae]|nr:uncharacterized protein LOC127602196 isoform X2 [Hippocampus zosterae]
MEGGSLFFSVQTSCHHADSEPIFLNVTYPELVRNVQCSITSSTLTQCSWVLLGSPPDFAFYYLLVNEVDDVPSGVMSLSECPRYTVTEGVRTGCHLQSKTYESIHILFNATLKKGLVRNTFEKKPVQVTPPPLKWNVSKVAGKFNLSWDPPDVLGLAWWTFIINYTECGKEKIQMVEGETWKLMSRVSHCPYRMTLKAQSDRGDSEWSEVKYFDKESNASLYAAIIIPLLCAILVTLTCVCCRRNQERIFNKVPEPRDLLSDIRNNTKNERIFNPYFPEKEEEVCQISVVKDQQQHPHTTHSHLIN